MKAFIIFVYLWTGIGVAGQLRDMKPDTPFYASVVVALAWPVIAGALLAIVFDRELKGSGKP